MAKRNRKKTLFDVMSEARQTGTPLVRDRAGFGRPIVNGRAANAGAVDRDDRRPTAADELAALRRGRERQAEVASPASFDDRSIPLEPVTEFKIAPPRDPRTPISEHVRRLWAAAAPKVAGATRSAGEGVRSVGRGTASLANAGWGQARRVRDIDTRYLWTGSVAAASIALLVGAFYVGRLLFRGPTDTLVAGTNSAEVNPDVLNVGNARNETSTSLTKNPPETRVDRAPVAPATPKSTVFGGRDLSLNYVVIETYNTPEDAAAAAEVLAKYKIRTTVEKNLPAWRTGNQDRYMLVGVDGFAKVSTPDFAAYIAALDKVSEREAGNTLPAKLKHGAYKWRSQ